MPSLLTSTFAPCIRNLPVAEHAIEVNSEFWLPHFRAAGLQAMHRSIFGNNPSIPLSRGRLLGKYSNPAQKCAEILLWGYPKDLHKVASKLLPKLGALATASRENLPWMSYLSGFPSGAKSSTVTKMAYFHGISFNGLPALILDNKVAGEIGRWQPIPPIKGLGSGKGGDKHYLAYLAAMDATSKRLGCAGDQLEFFLFEIGSAF